ncbi:polysaccharide pyruvyl transferase family protein [Psychrobacillus sp. INOP01]|uniref:polysaccharide pyruvyl transferase family protein n=1 Tax=Psychrobacillus sp. INOP01 TaxID=2829187 RepID=UPI001BAA742D|nr:polysaccharide pyruvyl transferase family protein [Psychrobacillus sp. INOP01]QUG40596.1 polysaccharide pyruvyl transferase family protein [Psychrobacillus sp. INOP01]
MRVLLIGEYYSPNLGDGVICNVVENLLINYFDDVEIIVADISGKKAYNTAINRSISLEKEKYTSFKLKLSKTLTVLGVDLEYKRFKRGFKNNGNIEEICSGDYDLAIFAGGQMFKDSFVLPISKFVQCLGLNNIPIIFNACGVGEIKSKRMKGILVNSLSNPNVRAISSRDDINTLNDYIVNSHLKATKTFDPAIWTDEVYKITKKKNNVVGLGVMYAYNMSQSRMVKFWKDVIGNLEERGIEWKIFCNGSIIDYKFAQYILSTLGYSEEKQVDLLSPRPLKPNELVELISTFKSIVSFRLHSHIIAYSLDIPGISIVWDEKIKYFYKSLGLESRCKYLRDSSSEIITELEQAEKEGYDSLLRTNQKESYIELLTKMIKEVPKS